MFRKFGMPFDHIYAYEKTPTEPESMVESIPEHIRPAYHWINVAVNASKFSIDNPLRLIHNHYNKDDIIIVKLDIDNDRIEQEFVQQILQDAKNHTKQTRIDHFYFEHHLGQNHPRKKSIELFTKLRKVGIGAHYWV